jgi:hypothetical protein
LHPIWDKRWSKCQNHKDHWQVNVSSGIFEFDLIGLAVAMKRDRYVKFIPLVSADASAGDEG